MSAQNQDRNVEVVYNSASMIVPKSIADKWVEKKPQNNVYRAYLSEYVTIAFLLGRDISNTCFRGHGYVTKEQQLNWMAEETARKNGPIRVSGNETLEIVKQPDTVCDDPAEELKIINDSIMYNLDEYGYEFNTLHPNVYGNIKEMFKEKFRLEDMLNAPA